MLVHEVMNLVTKSAFDRSGSPMKIPNMYKNVDYGKRMKVRPYTITIKSTGKDGKVYGHRTIMSK